MVIFGKASYIILFALDKLVCDISVRLPKTSN